MDEKKGQIRIFGEKLIEPLPKRRCLWYSSRGGMAEWSIAAVLKTAGLTAPGVRIPFPPFQFWDNEVSSGYGQFRYLYLLSI